MIREDTRTALEFVDDVREFCGGLDDDLFEGFRVDLLTACKHIEQLADAAHTARQQRDEAKAECGALRVAQDAMLQAFKTETRRLRERCEQAERERDDSLLLLRLHRSRSSGI